jgi:hypothetical protein
LTVAAFVVAIPGIVRFFETGIGFPRIGGRRRLRSLFLPWGEVERYYWVSDLLYLSTAKAVHTCAIRPRNRSQVDTILARYVAARAQ